MRCPCKICKNKYFKDIEDIKLHVLRQGFTPKYLDWVCHVAGLKPHLIHKSSRVLTILRTKKTQEWQSKLLKLNRMRKLHYLQKFHS
ncbi:unnamed protein product [Cuscuta campestris]|uniref:Transposase-associated domain-containing protein n=1 Tax=Cuscuta campestris TaxID=132261 RepID=A0A484NU33_9ASTE|nr:unnamed protein product [Cuscuta campestris]